MRHVLFSSASGPDDARWLRAARIVRALPRDRFDVRPLAPEALSDSGSLADTWILADSDDPACRAHLRDWRRLGAAVSVVVVDPTQLQRLPVGEVCQYFVESGWSADFLRRALGVDARVLSPGLLRRPASCDVTEPGYVTFVDPTPSRGVDLFVRLADEVGRLRPDIPLLVVEGRGSEADLAARGVDLRLRGNVHLMAPPSDPRQVWEVTRVLVAPLTDPWDGGFLCAAPLGLPVIAADHPVLRQLLGPTCHFAPLPDWMTPGSRRLPEAEEIQPWIDAVIRFWDRRTETPSAAGRGFFRASDKAAGDRKVTNVVTRADRPSANPEMDVASSRAGWAVLVPFLNAIEPECEAALHALEQAGAQVARCRGCSAIDQARSLLASQAIGRGSTSMLFIDSDLAFDPADALRLFARPEPVVAGVYTKKNMPALSSSFPPEITSVEFGAAAPGLYPLQYAAAGFLRIHTDVLRLMIERLALPLCNTHLGEGLWPFFLPLVLPRGDGSHHYLAEDWAFSHRLAQIGITPFADTTIRLYHLGMHGYTWEDTMRSGARYESFTFNFSGNG